MNGNIAINVCRGRGVEIGALSNPAPLQADVIYADICDKAAMKAVLSSLRGGPYYDLDKLVEPQIILQAPHYLLPLANGELDFVYSSHALEHTSNLIAALYDQLRCVKVEGVVYFVIPNRRGTYDNQRPSTSAARMIQRFEQNTYSFSMEDTSELLWGTANHAHYEEKTPARINEIHASGQGVHHYFVFTPSSILEILNYATRRFNCELVYFSAVDPVNINVCLKKKGESQF
jgi:hypothetical protein